MKFTPRLTSPSKTDKRLIYYDNGGISIVPPVDKKTGLTIPNCVGYFHFRWLELLGCNRPNWKIPGCNAEDCYDKAIANGFKVGTEPKLGAGIVWRAGKTHNWTDGAGHIGVVEEIKANGDIVVSQSAYGGQYFYLTTLSKASGYIYSTNRPLVGFIYIGIEYDAPAPTTSGNIVVGQAVNLNYTKCYNSETAKDAYGTKTGTFYLWDDMVSKGRIKITNSPLRVGVPGQVTCWINIADVGLSTSTTPTQSTTSTIEAGTAYTLNNVPVYSSESGASIGKRTGIYRTWDNVVKNGRIRMTNSASRVGVPGQVSFWVDVANLK